MRVELAILPPTIITVPTSEMARPKPARTASSKEKRQSQRIHFICDRLLKWSVFKVSPWIAQPSAIICLEIAAMSGMVMSDWAIIIPVVENSRPRLPRGPDLESNR